MLANCRSVVLKIESVVNFFDNGGYDFAILTETWINASNEIKIREEFEQNVGLGIILKNKKLEEAE